MHVAIIGAGIIGVTAAHAFLDEGHNVTILDRDGPAAGTSRGNAGWIAHTDILPLASAKTLWRVPKFLLDPLGPLSIRPAHLPRLVPWLARFLWASRPAAVEASTRALIALQSGALPAWKALLRQTKLERHVIRRGGLYVFDDPVALAAEETLAARQRGSGIAATLIGADELFQLEPALSRRCVGAAFHPDAAHVSDPRLLTMAMFEAALARGAGFQRLACREIRPGEATITLAGEGGERLDAGAVVLAAGVWSKPLAARLGDAVPLETERGYNVSFPGVTSLLSRPVAFPLGGFVATPLATGLRIGGAVELGGLTAAPNHARTRAIHEKARGFLDGLPPFESGTVWMGHRPSTPDSLPVIGRSRASPRVLHAFGHGHLGLTQAAVTARHLADLLAGRAPAIDLSPFSPQRF